MENRVIPFAKKLGADYYKPRPNQKRRNWLKQNKAWIKKQMKDKNEIIDIGPGKGQKTRRYYGMEKKAIRKYQNKRNLEID